METGIQIKEIRKKCLMSQMDFAKALDVSFSTVNRWENGKSRPSYKAMNKIKELCQEKSVEFTLF